MNERGEYDTYVYTLTMPSKVTDLTLLTSEMQVFCRGKDMYWADKKEQEEEHGLANSKCSEQIQISTTHGRLGMNEWENE